MKNEHDRLSVLFGALLAVGWAAGSKDDAWSIPQVIPAFIFGIAVAISSIKRSTPISHGIVNWLFLPLLICLVVLAVVEGGIVRILLTVVGTFVAFLILHRIASLRRGEDSSGPQAASNGT